LIPIKRHSRLSLQVVDHHRNLVGTQIRQHPINVVGIRQRNSAIFAKIRLAQISATVFRPSSWIWPERPNFGQSDPCRLARIWLEQLDSGLLAGFQRFWQIPASMPESGNFWPESGPFRWNPANPDSDETVRIRPLFGILAIVAGMAESGKSGQNPVGQ
jgi:hypothetical protein